MALESAHVIPTHRILIRCHAPWKFDSGGIKYESIAECAYEWAYKWAYERQVTL